MSKRTLAAAIAVALLASLGWSAPSHAGTWTVTLDTPMADVTGGLVGFSGITGSISNEGNVSFVGLSGSTSETVGFTTLGNNIGFTFSPGLTSSVTKFSFNFTDQGTSAPTILYADWFNGSSYVGDPSGKVGSAAVPEPASLAMLGIGMIGILSCRRFFQKKAI